MEKGDRDSDFAAEPPSLAGRDAPEQFLGEIRWEFEHDAWKILRCLEQLRDDELDWRPNESCNSAASLIVHICGSTDQWISAIAGKDCARNRPAEFTAPSDMDRRSLVRLVESSVSLAIDTLARIDPATLNRLVVIQGFENSILTALYTAERHQAEHIGQLVYIAKLKRGKAFKTLWVPADEAQSASPYGYGLHDNPGKPEDQARE